MRNEKLENQKISNDNAENVAGGIKFHVDTTTPIPKISTVYLSKKEYSELKKAGIIDKNNTFNMRNVSALGRAVGGLEMEKFIFEKCLLTTDKAWPWEHEVKISNSKAFLEE